MKVIIAGSRTITDHMFAEDAMGAFIKEHGKITEIVSGGARGADQLGEELAHFYMIPLKRFPADWDAHGKAAGPIRNRQMAEYADGLSRSAMIGVLRKQCGLIVDTTALLFGGEWGLSTFFPTNGRWASESKDLQIAPDNG